ncbi:MAM domain-containing protein 2-like [Ostrea edulis]|uniref:MAM domain-containing protein 2-like n=1 Tax=Ostrea edulis TaxID=37623 RepID=UPI0024AF4ECE|nr:MAM domain-containing protein 2-like [Ostrea edulis]
MRLGILFMWLFSAFSRTKQCENFRYTKDVPPASSFQVISNVSAASLEYLYAMCTADCFSHIECNAIDVCGTFCRLIRGWDSIYTEGNTSEQCQRYQVECGQGEFYDRVSKTCVSHDYCDFESDSEPSCFLAEDNTDDGDWIRNQGATPTSSTGPSIAKFGSYYKYVDTATLNTDNEVTLVSTKTFTARPHCLTLYYHMFGAHTGNLSVLVTNGTSPGETKWTVSGENQDIWKQVVGIDLDLDPQTQILITARKDNGTMGDIAVDFIELWPYRC